MATKRKPRPAMPEPEAPAVIRGHVQDRAISPVAGAPMAWRNPTPLEQAYEKDRLGGGNAKYAPEQRLEAGKRYSRLWDTAYSSGKDSTDIDRVSGGPGGGYSQAKADAFRSLTALDSHLGQRDRIIIRMVCGQGHFPSEAVRLACGDYTHTVAARFREALDALIEALETVRRAPGTFNMERGL